MKLLSAFLLTLAAFTGCTSPVPSPDATQAKIDLLQAWYAEQSPSATLRAAYQAHWNSLAE